MVFTLLNLDITNLSNISIIINDVDWQILLNISSSTINSNIPELHDRLIVATCLQENVEALITSDQEILEGNEISVIWS